MNDPIDIIVPWVDSSDLVWEKKRARYSKNSSKELNGRERYRDYDTLKYLFRSIERYAAWVNKVYLVTDRQTPTWLNLNNDKIVVVNHNEYIAEAYLPTFNSNVIECNFFKIKKLSNNFILFNDDMLFNGPTKERDFFINNTPRDSAIQAPVFPTKTGIDHTVVNNLAIINDKFNKRKVILKNWKKFYSVKYGKDNFKNMFLEPYGAFCGFVDFHVPIAYNKKLMTNVFKENKIKFTETFKNKFRSNNDVSQWLFRYYQLCVGNFVPRRTSFGVYLTIDQVDKINETLKDEHIKLICLNDKRTENFDKYASNVQKRLEEKFQKKSKFEL